METLINRKVRRWFRRAAERVHPPTYVLGRVACLGQEVFNRRLIPGARRTALLNMQKVRCDAALEWIHSADRPALQTRPDLVKPHLARPDIDWLLDQQQRMIWFERRLPIAYAVMDSFAELTDQRFRHRRHGWTFACHYSDLHHTPAFQAEFEPLNLLPLEQIAPTYRRFFDWFDAAHPGVPVYFIHFPAALDSRPVFQQRAAAIRDAIESLTARRLYLHSLSLPDADILKAPGDDFPYHFAPETFDRFAARWAQLLAS